MRTGIIECKHCLDDYLYQYSGEPIGDIPRELKDDRYCPACKKVIVDALSIIPKKFEYKWIDTDEVDLDTLIRWEKEWLDVRKSSMLPLARRVFMSLYDENRQEYSITREVNGRYDKIGRTYIYSYWPSKKEDCKITRKMKVRI